MRRPLVVVALALVLLGIEVATGAISVGATRLWTGFGAVLAGDEWLVSPLRYVSGVTIACAGVALLAALLWVEAQSQGIVTVGSTCPNCGTSTRRVRRRKRHRVLSRILETHVTRRHCERCGWNGLAA